jgi:hypothetical protein
VQRWPAYEACILLAVRGWSFFVLEAELRVECALAV